MGAKPLGIRINVFGDLVEGDFKPFGIAFRMGFHVVSDIVEVHVFVGCYLVGVDDGGVITLSEPDMVELMFDESQSNGCFIYKGKDLVHVAGHAHFFLQPSCRSLFKAFAIAGMAAAGVGP